MSCITPYLVEGGEDDANEARVELLVCGLGADVHMAGQDCDVGVRVVPADDPDFETAVLRQLLCRGHRSCQLLRAGLNSILHISRRSLSSRTVKLCNYEGGCSKDKLLPSDSSCAKTIAKDQMLRLAARMS